MATPTVKTSKEEVPGDGRIRDGCFSRERIIHPRNIDALGHVNNLVWVRFVVELATAHSAHLGWDETAYRRHGAWWVIHRQEITYHAPAFVADPVVEETWISLMKGGRCVRESRLRRGDALLLSARTTWVWTEATSGRPRRIPAAMLESFPVLDPE
jgi:acyl-CoA thioester hydrolase